jgi:ATP-binding cassette subfamily B protein
MTLPKRVRRVWSLLDGLQQLSLGSALSLMAAVAALSAGIPVVLGRLVDGLLGGAVRGVGAALPWLGALAAAYFVREALQLGRKMLVESACASIEKQATVRLAAQLLAADLESLAAERIGSLQGRLCRSVEGLVRFIKLGFLDLLPALLGAAFALAAVAWRRWDLALLLAAFAPASALLVRAQIASQRGVRLELLRAKEELAGTLVEQLLALEHVRVAHTERREVDRIERVAEHLRKRALGHHVAMARFDGAKTLNEGVFHVGVLAFAVVLAVRGSITCGDVLTFSTLFTAVVGSLREVHRIFDEAHESSLSVDQLFATLDQPVDRSFTVAAQRQVALAEGAPVFEARDLRVGAALDGVSLAIHRGEVAVVTGPSGAGKSTLLRAFARLAHPSGGALCLGGTPLGDVGREELARLIGYLGQSPQLFTGTVEENIAYGCEGATADAVRRAAQLACIDDEIRRMPGGYHARIRERGQNLSGGQRQRIALARALLKDPPILLLDEPTAALDQANEEAVLRALASAMAGSTVILVTHRLAALPGVDRVLVLERGRVVSDGRFALDEPASVALPSEVTCWGRRRA